jgi:hypothetical protein
MANEWPHMAKSENRWIERIFRLAACRSIMAGDHPFEASSGAARDWFVEHLTG